MNEFDMFSEGKSKDIFFLQRSFDEFSKATLTLQKAFERLEEKFESINKELENKNRELQRALTEKEEVKDYLQNILESLSTGVVVVDMAGKITMMNQCAEIFTGVSQGDAKGKCTDIIFEFFPILDSKDWHRAEYNNNEIRKKVRVKGRILEIFRSPVMTSTCQKIGMVILFRDVTRIERLEEMAKRTEKMVAMGEMAANIAHQIRNPLGSIELFASLLMKESSEGKNQDRASNIINAVKSMDNKISNLLLFTRQQKPLMKEVNINEALKEVLVFSEQIIQNENIELTINYRSCDPFIEGDSEMLKQVFLNLILNALQAMPEGGKLIIETRIDDDRDDRELPGANVEIKFIDSGIGIPAEARGKIFDPFFTTKERETGLGLAIVHNIVDIHGGSISVESNKNKRTAFTVTLPLLQ